MRPCSRGNRLISSTCIFSTAGRTERTFFVILGQVRQWSPMGALKAPPYPSFPLLIPILKNCSLCSDRHKQLVSRDFLANIVMFTDCSSWAGVPPASTAMPCCRQRPARRTPCSLPQAVATPPLALPSTCWRARCSNCSSPKTLSHISRLRRALGVSSAGVARALRVGGLHEPDLPLCPPRTGEGRSDRDVPVGHRRQQEGAAYSECPEGCFARRWGDGPAVRERRLCWRG